MSATPERSATGLPAAPAPRPRPERPGRTPAAGPDDPLFTGLLTTLSLVAAGFWGWVVTTPLPPETLPVAADVARFVEELPVLVMELPIPSMEVVPEAAPAPRARPEARSTSAPAEAPGPAGPSKPRGSVLIEQLGHFGKSGTALEAVVGADDLDVLERAVANVKREELVFNGVGVGSGGARGGDVPVKLGSTGAGAIPVGLPAQGTVVKVRPKVVAEAATTEVTAGGDASAIASVVRAHRGRIDTCLGHALKGDPELYGRVSVGWTIRAGRVTEAHLVENDTGNDALGDCVVKAVRAFRFPEGLDATVAAMPWMMDGE